MSDFNGASEPEILLYSLLFFWCKNVGVCLHVTRGELNFPRRGEPEASAGFLRLLPELAPHGSSPSGCTHTSLT